MATHAAPHDEGGLDALFEASPDLGVHTSATAEGGLILGLAALLAAPFSVTHGLTLVLGLAGGLLALRGLAATSNANVAGRALAPWGLASAILALLVVAPRYLGVETAFGDELLPWLRALLEDLNARIGRP